MFDINKPVQTRDGRPARIVSTQMGGKYPILAIIDEGLEGVHAARYTMKGRFIMTAPGETALDLVNVPDEPVEQFYNVYLKNFYIAGPKESRAEADEDAGIERSFVLRVLREDGRVSAVELA